MTTASETPAAARRPRIRVSSGTPQKGSAGFARRSESGPSRSPRPAANTIARAGAAAAGAASLDEAEEAAPPGVAVSRPATGAYAGGGGGGPGARSAAASPPRSPSQPSICSSPISTDTSRETPGSSIVTP